MINKLLNSVLLWYNIFKINTNFMGGKVMYMVNVTSDNFSKKVKSIKTIVVPIGSVEAHGHHLPLGTDIFSPRVFCNMLEEKISDLIWIAPEIPFGQSYDLSIYPGTIHVPTEVLAQYIYEVGRSLFENGIKNIIFLNGHGGNVNALNLASEKLMALGVAALTINWWVDYSKDILTITEGQGHGGEDETSAVLFYNESLVEMDKAIDNNRKPTMRMYFKDRGKVIYKDALSGNSTLATKEKGEKIFSLVSDRIIETINMVISETYYTD